MEKQTESGAMIRFFIFDIGDVLVNVKLAQFIRDITRAFNISRIRLLLNHDPRVMNQLMSGEITIIDLHRSTCERYKKEVPFEIYKRIWLEMLDGLNKEMVQLVKELKPHYQPVILSNIESVHYEHLIQTFPFFQIFSPHFLSYQIGVAKPDFRIYEHVLNQLKATPEECFFIDDRAENIKGAQKMGIRSHHFRSRKRLVKELKRKGLL